MGHASPETCGGIFLAPRLASADLPVIQGVPFLATASLRLLPSSQGLLLLLRTLAILG